MKASPTSRLPVLLAVWLGTALLTFALGRLSAPPLAARPTPAPTPLPAAAPAAGQTLADFAASLDAEVGSAAAAGRTPLARLLGGRSIEEHVRHLLKQDDDAVRMAGFLRLVESLERPEEIKAALTFIASGRDGRYRSTEQALLLQKWAKIDPRAAADFAGQQRDWSRFAGVSAVLRTWLRANPAEAIAWAEQQGGAPAEGRDRDEGNWVLATAIGPFARQSLDRAIEVAASQPVSRARGAMIENLVGELVAQRGEDGARAAVVELPDSPFRAGMAGKLAEQLARKDAASAAAWAMGLPAGDTRERAISTVVAEWAEDDPVAAGRYLQQWGSAPELDDARARYAGEVLRKDPEGAMSWAITITDARQRGEVTQELLRAWMRRDQPAAAAWAQANGIAVPPAQR